MDTHLSLPREQDKIDRAMTEVLAAHHREREARTQMQVLEDKLSAARTVFEEALEVREKREKALLKLIRDASHTDPV